MSKSDGSKVADDFKNALEGLMHDFESGVFNRADDGKELGDIIAPTPNIINDIDLFKMDVNLRKDANEVVNSLYKMYFTAGILKKYDYILKRKQQLDSLNLGNMLFQINTVKMSIISALQLVQSSQDPDPRLWRSITDLQTVFADLTKNLANYVVYLENNYRIQKTELEEGNYNVPVQIGSHKEYAAIAEKSESLTDDTDTDNDTGADDFGDNDADDLNDKVVEVSVDNLKVIKRKGSNLNLITNAKNLVDEVIKNNNYNLSEKLKDTPLTSPHRKDELATSKGIDLSAIEEESDYDQLSSIV